MCGIIGYIGSENCVSIMLNSLKKLEYRGYDSMGLAISDGKNIRITKSVGKFEKLEESVRSETEFFGNCAIGHTRWATHGKPDVKNAHPHEGSRFVIVHNGIIENYMELKKEYLADEVFESDTDTEVALRLFELFNKTSTNIASALRMLFESMNGSYAFCIMDKENPGVLYAVKNKSPLLIGKGEGFNMVGSDINAMLEKTNSFYELKNMEYAVVTRDNVEIYSSTGNRKIRNTFVADKKQGEDEKGKYPHYMLKEMEEQPSLIRRSKKAFLNEEGELQFDSLLISEMKKSDRVYIVACGTSYHCALLGKLWFEKIPGISAEAVMAGEFGSLSSTLVPNPFYVFISQSGETADCISAMSAVKKKGYLTLSVTNSEVSSLSRESDFSLDINAGTEIAVASTKAYTMQAVTMYLLANALADKRNPGVKRELDAFADAVKYVCENKEVLKQLAERELRNNSTVFYMGKGADYYVSLEAALKLKEISYINTVGIAASELKHGTLALIDESSVVFTFVTQEEYAANIRSNINEVASRGARVCVLSSDKLCSRNDSFSFPDVGKYLSPLVGAVCSQYIAYYAALARGLDIDRPRNLAKSVTVE